MKSRMLVVLASIIFLSSILASCDGETKTIVRFIETYLKSSAWGSSGDDVSYWVAFDSKHNVYVVGYFEGGPTDFDTSAAGTDNHTSNGDKDCYLTKYDSDHNFLWAKTWGGTSEDIATVITTDSDGNVYVGGHFQDNVDFNPDPVGIASAASNGGYDLFLSKFDAAGNFIWVKTWGGSEDEEINSITIDSQNTIYLGGYFEDTVDFDPAAGSSDDHTSLGKIDAFLMKFSTSGFLGWAKTWGGSEEDSVESVATDSSKKVYAAGFFAYSKNPPTTPPDVDFNPDPIASDIVNTNGYGDCYTSKFDSAGNFLWVRTFGGVEDDNIQSIAIDNADNFVVVGRWGTKWSPAGYILDFDPDPVDTSNRTCAGGKELFVVKFDSTGDFLWVQTAGSDDNENVKDVAIDRFNNIYICGYFFTTADFNPDFNVVDNKTSVGEDDCFLCCYDKAGTYKWTKTWGSVYREDANCVKYSSNKRIYVVGCVGFMSIPGSTIDMNPDPNVDDIITMNGDGDSFFMVFK